MWSGFKSRRRRHMWIEFVVGSLLCSERFFSRYSGFPLSSKTNISKFQFDQESGRRRTTLWMCYLIIIIIIIIIIIGKNVNQHWEEGVTLQVFHYVTSIQFIVCLAAKPRTLQLSLLQILNEDKFFHSGRNKTFRRNC